MTRHKSRVARRSRHRARRGTRKQSGGVFDWLTRLTGLFGSKPAAINTERDATDPNASPTVTQNPGPATGPPAPPGPPLIGGRKTRHRRRRSPRHHRK